MTGWALAVTEWYAFAVTWWVLVVTESYALAVTGWHWQAVTGWTFSDGDVDFEWWAFTVTR